MTDTHFQPIFDYLDEHLKPLGEKIDGIDKKVNTHTNTVDSFAKEIKDFRE